MLITIPTDISVLNIFSKTVQRVVYNQLSEYLESNNLLSDNQYGFRRKRSTRDAVTKATDHIREHMDKGKVTGALFMDLRKAFDSVNHSCLLHKLPYYGILGREVEWICSYLFHRSQIITIDGVHHTRCDGVPQAHILIRGFWSARVFMFSLTVNQIFKMVDLLDIRILCRGESLPHKNF